MSVSIAIVCEGSSDPPAIRALADRIIAERIGWIAPDEIETHRHFRGFETSSPYLAWQDIRELATEKRVRSLGHFRGLPLHGDGHRAREAIVLLTFRTPSAPVDAIIFFRDGDRDFVPKREAILRVRDEASPAIPIVVGVANPMRECWHLNGFEPLDDVERARFEAESKAIQFNPSMRAHDLTSQDKSDARHPKRVLAALTERDPERELHCLAITSLNALRSRGMFTGLGEFIEELESRLVTAFK